jgi:L-threonylcarbamoyladenylate synthase
MQVITKAEVRLRREEIRDKILNGDVFIYPTDTIYGLGCDATNPKAVKKIRDIKERQETPFSIIAPSIEWIKENCEITKDAEKWLKELPGPITLILKLKNKECIAKEVNPGLDSLGVRIPDHWITSFISMIETPIVTTSVNRTDKPFMVDIEELDRQIKMHIPFAIYEGPKQGRPSKIIHLESEETKIRER